MIKGEEAIRISMKLRNKKTGEIDDYIFEVITDRIDLYRRVENSDTKNVWHYNSLSKLNADWEDYEEPKEYWMIDGYGKVHEIFVHSKFIDEEKEIGNYFNTREEAEKAVEKLKAWKRLKEKNFRYCGWVVDHKKKCGKAIFKATDCAVTCNEAKQFYEDLDLLFGGEE